jgi:hypothetical protein
MDPYKKGLNGRQAGWAARRYHGHCVLPESLMDDLEQARCGHTKCRLGNLGTGRLHTRTRPTRERMNVQETQ